MKVSVVIPVYNEERFLGNCLKSLQKQSVLPDEVLVVNNNSTDKTIEIAKKFGARIVNEKTQGMTPTRNRGFNMAKYEVIARCDADTILPKDWIKIIKKNFASKKIDALSGPVHYYDSKFFGGASKILAHPISQSMKAFANGNIYMFGPNMALTKKIWRKVKNLVNLDDSKVHEDIDLTLNITKVGGKIGYDKKLVVLSSARRLKRHPESFFFEYPVRIVRTFIENKDALKLK